jgi:hypothetical protein
MMTYKTTEANAFQIRDIKCHAEVQYKIESIRAWRNLYEKLEAFC